MDFSPSPFRCCRGLAGALLLAGLAAVPAAAQTAPSPYVFFLFDSSGSMNWSPPCTQSQLDAGACGFLCPTGDCYLPLQGDDPASKMYLLKAGLYSSIADRDDLLLGFASMNQDGLFVRAKHWLYQAVNNGPLIPGAVPYPAAGAREVFGLNWACDSGNNNNETGCYPASPALLTDPWAVSRMQRMAKGGLLFTQLTEFYVRSATGTVYKIRYTPSSGSLGASLITANVALYRCNNVSCSSVTVLGTQSVSWQRVGDFVSWDDGDPSFLNRTNPALSYFTATAVDASATNTCSGWDPNSDDSADLHTGYSLRWPTDLLDTRGAEFSSGDILPLDWTNSQKLQIEQHLAPNLVLNPTAAPDFRIATYLKDSRTGPETFLRLKDENARPLIAVGSTPLGNSLASFRSWYSGCAATCPTPGGWAAVASAQDPDWANRHVSVVLLTDGDDTCGGDPCSQARDLHALYGVRTFVVAFGAQPVAGGAIECAADAGGTVAPYYPQTKQELVDDLAAIYAAAANP